MDWPMEVGSDLQQAWVGWIQGVADTFFSAVFPWGVIVVALVFLIPLVVARTVRRRSFWCAQA